MTTLKERPDVVRSPEPPPTKRRPIQRRRLRRFVGWTVAAMIVLAGAVALTAWLVSDDGVGNATLPANEISTGYLVKLPSGEYTVVPRAATLPANEISTGYLVKLPSGEYMVVPRTAPNVAADPAITFVELPSGELLEVPATRTIELPSGEYLEVPLSDGATGALVDPSTSRP